MCKKGLYITYVLVTNGIMSPSLSSIEDKWYRKLKGRVRSAINELQKSATFDDYAEALSAIEGMPSKSSIKDSPAGKSFKEEVDNIEVSEVMDAIEKAHDRNLWSDNFAKAFSRE